MKHPFAILGLLFIFGTGMRDLHKKVLDLTERRLIMEENANLLNDEQIQAGEFRQLMKKIDAIDEEIQKNTKLSLHDI